MADEPEIEATPEAAAPDLAPAEPPAASESGIAQVRALSAEVADLRDRLLRAAAEMENTRKRAEREIADARAYALTGFAGDIVGIGDNLRRAIEAAPEAAHDETNPAATLLTGVEMTEREFLRTLEKHGVRRIDPKGEKFDPHRHQAIFEVETTEAAPGTVMQVVQAGYLLRERVVRPALVGVAKVPRPVAPPVVEAEVETVVSDPAAANRQ